MSTQAIVEELQEVKIPKILAGRIRKIAPYGRQDSIDTYVASMLDEFISQIEANQTSKRKYNPFSDEELERIREEISDYSLYS